MMNSNKPYIGCKIGLISRAHNRYEGILYTIDKVNSTVVLAKVKCFGTEGRPTDRPTPPKDDIYEYITFRGNDIKDIALCELPRSHHGLPADPAIIQSSSAGSSGVYPAHGPFSPHRMPVYNQLAASSLLHQQYAAAVGLGPVLPGLPVRRGPTVEKAVQTLHVERSMQRRSLTVSQEQEPWWERRRPQRTREEGPKSRRGPGTFANLGQALPKAQLETRQPSDENRPPPRRRQGPRRRRNRSRGQLMVANVPSPVLKFDTDFDFDSSNAQFIKEELERGGQDKRKVKDGNHEVEEKGKEKEELRSTAEDDQFGPKCYYDKAKSFFDNISSDNTFSFRLTWAEERKRNLETFGVPGRFLRGRGFRGGYTGPRGRGAAQTLPPYRTRSGQL
ncbi:protein LSM14 homolog B isoform X1 [Scophthalmus maximus]|uniref:protein LSM14 homolog B isoform X1 n=1 Tax=Scophthalmus maximus TaxID=52904 RepID=UPI001FA93EA1|nr:protein LSM14 homolog B isoform X1 [Scophthalmus maximus]XP_047186805.1 protein LSM14 homolog B isoform X1 [Scophthalmus maximus]